MGFSFAVGEFHLADSTVVTPPGDGMTVFIGPNNSGKSVLLNELAIAAASYPGAISPRRWIRSLDISTNGSTDEFRAWLHEQGEKPTAPPERELVYSGDHDAPTALSTLVNAWESRNFGPIGRFLVVHKGSQDRLSNHTDSSQWNFDFPPSHPTQYLFDDRDAHQEFSAMIQAAFGEPIAINRYEHQIRLQVGHPGMADEVPPPSPELRAAYRRLQTVNEQGDGFRSFVNLLLHTLVRPRPVIVIDEPEAFLHPPQARLLGRNLAERTPSPCQVFVATHSSDFLSGVLEANSKPVSLVRISRTAGSPQARVLQPEAVTDILRTPALRYSNIISGLFHDGVVLGESEGDCQFYAATIDVLHKGRPNDNLVFLHTNGKAKIIDTAQRLRDCGIPVAVIADLDLLNDRYLLRRVLERFGDSFAEIEADVAILEKHASSTITANSAQEIKEEINKILGNPGRGAAITDGQGTKIKNLLKTSGAWKGLKRGGLRSISGTNAYGAVQRLMEYFAGRGVFLVPVGELEGWVPEVPSGDKSKWLARVFEEEYHLSPADELADFCAKVSTYLSSMAARDQEKDRGVQAMSATVSGSL